MEYSRWLINKDDKSMNQNIAGNKLVQTSYVDKSVQTIWCRYVHHLVHIIVFVLYTQYTDGQPVVVRRKLNLDFGRPCLNSWEPFCVVDYFLMQTAFLHYTYFYVDSKLYAKVRVCPSNHYIIKAVFCKIILLNYLINRNYWYL